MVQESLADLYHELGEHTVTPAVAEELTKHDDEAEKLAFEALAKATAARDEADYGVFLDAPVPGIEYTLLQG